MFEWSVEYFGGAVASPGAVEIGQDVTGSFLQCAPQGDDLTQGGRYAARDCDDQLSYESFAFASVGLAVGGHHLLVHAPGHLDLSVVTVGEEHL